MGSRKSYVLVAFSALFIGEGLAAGAKTVTGLKFELSPPPKELCLYQPFQVRHEPDAFFKNLKQIKGKGATQYRRGHSTVANYPDSTTVRVELLQGLPELNSCIPLPAFDPANLKFDVQWEKDSQIVRATGKFVVSKESSPRTWCENTCTALWVYELRIDSQDVPLQSNLVLTIATQHGTQLAKYVGKLSTAKIEQQQLPFNIAASPP